MDHLKTDQSEDHPEDHAKTAHATVESYCRRREAVLAEVRQLLIDCVDLRRQPDEIDPDTVLFGTGLGLDSVDAVEIVIALEVDMGVKLGDDRIRRRALRTVNAIVDAVLAAREPAPTLELAP